MFSPSKVAQMAAFFASKQKGGLINVMKVIKLMYLSDRESMRRFGGPISFDYMVSMNNGPVLSQTLNLINGDVSRAAAAEWDEWISDRADHDIAVKCDVTRADLDQLSNADIEILDWAWTKFGHMDQWQLSEYTHKNCPEWKYPKGSMLPIKEAELLMHLGKSREEAAAIADDIQTERELDQAFARL
jgi:uncharacterized phage-associated protein